MWYVITNGMLVMLKLFAKFEMEVSIYHQHDMSTMLTLFRIKQNFNYTNHYATTFTISPILPPGLGGKTKPVSMICHSLIHCPSWWFSRGVRPGGHISCSLVVCIICN